MYRPSKKPPKGAWARHLHEQRQRRDLSQTQAFELVYERIGWSRKSRTAYVAIDMGDRLPRGEEVTVLGAEFGWPPDPQDVEQEPDQGALIVALNSLAAEIKVLVGQVRDSARESAEAQAQTALILGFLARQAGVDLGEIRAVLGGAHVPRESAGTGVSQ